MSQPATIRRWDPADAPALHQAIAESLEHLRPWVPWARHEPRTLDQRRVLLADWCAAWDAGGDRVYGIFIAGAVAGGCGLHRRIGAGGLEIGYWTHAAYVRRGIATVAARTMTDHAFAMPGIDRVEIWHDKRNVPSGLVPRRLGFELIGEERRETPPSGVFRVWRMTRDAWRG